MDVVIPPPQEILARLRPEHPRLLASEEGFALVRQRIPADPLLARWCEQLRERAQSILGEPASTYEIPDGLRLLATSRRVLGRIYTLALLHRLEGEQRYAERAWQELEAATRFPDWNPRHFLDTAEMTHAFAIAYDWLYNLWSDDQRAALRAAIVEKGLTPAQAAYRGQHGSGWWPQSRHNWNQVCNGGIGMGALAIGDEAPEMAGEILDAALRSLQLPMARYAPDGAWDEGPGYWHYATSYNAVFLAALETAIGTDFGLAHFPGFADTGLFPIYLTGPLGRTFNYADGSDHTIRAPQMFWFARRFDRPIYAAYQRRVAAPDARDVLWHALGTEAEAVREPLLRTGASGQPDNPPDLPLDKYFGGVEVVTLRSAWEDDQAIFVGFKAGDNKANHSNLDLGTFVLDALGTRWALDLGADNYNMPGYFSKDRRWSYYRMRAEGHNTLVLSPCDAPDQNPSAAAAIVRFQSTPQRAFAIADFTEAYAAHARRVRRGVALLDRRAVLIQDEIEANGPVEFWWLMHTAAQIAISGDGAAATLTQDGARLWARLLAPEEARFRVMPARPLPSSPDPPEQAKNEDVRKLAVHLSGRNDLRLAVLLLPLREGEPPHPTVPQVVPLSGW